MKTIRENVRRITTAAASLIIGASLLAGCGKTEPTTPQTPADTNSDATATDAATDTGTDAGTDATSQDASVEPVTLKIGASVTPHAELLREVAPILAEQGITLEIIEMEDVVTPNTGVADGSLDANFFQHVPFLDSFNAENGTDLVSIGATHYEPFGLYAGKSSDLANIADGAVVGVPNNATNEARALLLLQQEGIITLKEGADITATVEDIEENPHNIDIKEIAPEQLVRSLPDLDFAIINGNYALEGGLKVKDALAVENADGVAAQTYKNVVVAKAENKDNAALKKLVEALQSQEIQDYINNTYDGAVVPVK
ncbi:MAG: MetQ/NlpA family ABC transporter substrate-binding protein [Lachnospiraceae bacterium]|nr:MetQ/NlpA family ABC transporter substrate-binding protein [Lachnospiraceae bacterium]